MFSREWRERLERDGFFAHVISLAGGTAAGQAIVVAATPIITRLYTPTEMGILAVFVSFVGFVGVGTGLRYEMAIVSAADERDADHLLGLSMMLTVPISALAALVLLWMVRADVWSYGKLPAWSAFGAGVAICATGMFTALRYWAVRRAGFKGIGRALVAQGVGRAGVSVAWGVVRGGWAGLLFSELAGRVFGIRSLLRPSWPSLRAVLHPFDGAEYKSVMRRYWRFPALVLPSSLVNSLMGVLPLPIVASLFGSAAAGHFLLAQRLTSLPSTFVGASVNDVMHNHMAELHQTDPRQLRQALLAVVKRLGVLAVAIYFPLAILAPLLGSHILGEQWTETGILVALLTAMFLVDLIVAPLSRVFIAVDRLELKFMIDALQVVPAFSLFFWHSRGWDFQRSVAAYSILASLAGLAYLGLIAALAPHRDAV